MQNRPFLKTPTCRHSRHVRNEKSLPRRSMTGFRTAPRPLHAVLMIAVILLGADILAAQQARRESESRRLAHFEKKIRPILARHCYACHSAKSDEIKGGLTLDTREGIRQGGDSGPAVVPGNPRGSLLLSAIRHEGGYEMPPEKKLSDNVIADFVTWIEAGAMDPRDGDVVHGITAIDMERGRAYWAFQKPVKVAPPQMEDAQWPRTDVDRFILSAQEEHGVRAVGDADPYMLARRLYFDLTGLPPQPEEILAFAENWRHDPQRTLEETVDRLLHSFSFAERWGRHWLDVARYAESSGNETSFAYPQAWRYRDYVIDSFHADIPFDQFVREQIAGDLLPAANPTQRAEQQIATGFLALGPKSHIERNKLQFAMDLADEQIDAVTQAFLGLTVACARCHDHKFDPIPQTDYYALAGIFRSTETLYGTIPVAQNRNPSQLLELPSEVNLPTGVASLTPRQIDQLDRQIEAAREQRNRLFRERKTGTAGLVRARIQLATLEGRRSDYESDGSVKRMAMGVRERKIPQDSPLYVRGEIENPGKTVPRGFVRVLCGDSVPTIDSRSGRRELADWIASPNNPLTARVIVNRIWLNLFGQGLVPTPDNFGMSGQPPSHPELLDYLAVTFVEDGWSVKRLIRGLVLSRVYQLDSTHDATNFETDPDNRWLWRMSPRRLDAEAIRDAMLAISGRLDLELPVGSPIARLGEGFTRGLERGSSVLERRFPYRSVYLPVIRGRSFESLMVFDGVDGSAVTGQRPVTTVPAQSLYLLNSPYVMELSRAAALRLVRERRNPGRRIDLAYLRWLGRPVTESEREAALEFLARYQQVDPEPGSAYVTADVAAWTALCQSLWAGGEFLVRR